jgi:hypothetical protein
MNDRNLDQILDAWMDLGPTVAPDRVADAARLEARSTRQRRAWWPARRFLAMNSPTRIGLAAAGVVAAVVVVVVLATPSPISLTGLFGDPEPTAVEIAEAYIEARNAYDPERARDLLADDFRTNEPPDGFLDASDLELAFEMHKAHKFRYSDGECSEGATSPQRTIVRCNYLWSTEMHRIAGHPPTPARFTFHVSDGRIRWVGHTASSAFYFGPRNFYGFLSGHPEFQALVDESFTLDPEATREVVERLPHYFELYEEWLSQQP